MKNRRATLLFSVVLAAQVSHCGAKAQSGGNPQMAAAIGEIAELACACKDKNCLLVAQIRGKSIAQWRMASTAQMTAEELEAANASWLKYNECESAKK